MEKIKEKLNKESDYSDLKGKFGFLKGESFKIWLLKKKKFNPVFSSRQVGEFISKHLSVFQTIKFVVLISLIQTTILRFVVSSSE